MSRPQFLIDTHVLLWAISGDQRLLPRHREILDKGGGLAVSVVSIWEIAIKRSTGKLTIDGDLLDVISSRAIPILRIDEHHAMRVELLAHHHRDPFDRLLIAQAQVEKLSILTNDPAFSRYDVALA